MASKKPRDIVWKFFHSQNDDGKTIAVCNYCESAKYSQNASRMKEHLGKCTKAPSNVREIYKNFDTHKADKGPITPASCCSSLSTEFEVEEVAQVSSTPSKKPLRQFFDSIFPQDAAEADGLLAKTIYAEGLSFRLAESAHFRSFVKILRPSYGVPSRFQLSGPLLNTESEGIFAERNAKFEAAESISLLTDGWSGCDNRSMINFLVACPEPIF